MALGGMDLSGGGGGGGGGRVTQVFRRVSEKQR